MGTITPMTEQEKHSMLLTMAERVAICSELLGRRAEGPISLLDEVYALRERISALEHRLLCLEAENRSLLMALDRAQWNNAETMTWQAGAGIPQL